LLLPESASTPLTDCCCANRHAQRDYSDALGGKVPVGAIDQSYGGTSIQFWMSEDAIAESSAPVATQCCKQDGGPSCLW
jgi:hypothetical protein